MAAAEGVDLDRSIFEQVGDHTPSKKPRLNDGTKDVMMEQFFEFQKSMMSQMMRMQAQQQAFMERMLSNQCVSAERHQRLLEGPAVAARIACIAFMNASQA